METASHVSRGRMMRNERGTSTPSLLTRQTVSPWLVDKPHRDGKYRDTHTQPATRAETHPVPSQMGAWALLTSHHSLEGGEGSQTLGRTWLSWPCCPLGFQNLDCHIKVFHGHQEYRTDLRSLCDTQPMTTTKQAQSGACLIFVVRKVSTKRSKKKSWQAVEEGRVQVPGLPQSFCVTLVELFIPCTPEQ